MEWVTAPEKAAAPTAQPHRGGWHWCRVGDVAVPVPCPQCHRLTGQRVAPGDDGVRGGLHAEAVGEEQGHGLPDQAPDGSSCGVGGVGGGEEAPKDPQGVDGGMDPPPLGCTPIRARCTPPQGWVSPPPKGLQVPTLPSMDTPPMPPPQNDTASPPPCPPRMEIPHPGLHTTCEPTPQGHMHPPTPPERLHPPKTRCTPGLGAPPVPLPRAPCTPCAPPRTRCTPGLDAPSQAHRR